MDRWTLVSTLLAAGSFAEPGVSQHPVKDAATLAPRPEAVPCYSRAGGCAGVRSLSDERTNGPAVAVAVAADSDPNGVRLAYVPGASTTRVLPAQGLSVHSLIHAPWVPKGQPAPLVDLNEFPAFANATPLLYTVNAGDTLYIPAFWWHWVMSEGDPESIAVNFWTSKPHRQTFLSGCKNGQPSRRCGHEPKLFPGEAAGWPATNNWDVTFLEQQWEWRVARDGAGSVRDRFGSCAAADHLYPEMYSAGVLDVSRYHQQGAPPIPKRFGDIAHAIRNSSRGECCHAVMSQSMLNPDAYSAGGVRPPPGALPPSANSGGIQALLWITGGNVTSGLHFDQDYNSLTVLRGTKRVFLFDPADTPFLYPASKHVQ